MSLLFLGGFALEGAFNDEPPATLEELVHLIEAKGEEATISALRWRGIRDTAVVSGAYTLTKKIGGRHFSFDAYSDNGRTVDLSRLEGIVITFESSNVRPLGFFEIDRDLTKFKIIQQPSEQEIRQTPVTCNTCSGDGREVKVDSFCYSCGGDGRIGEGTVFYRECPDCGGDGHVFWKASMTESRCSRCNGRGEMPRPR